MLRHATEKPSIVNGIRQELNCLQNTARDTPCSPLIHRSSPADSKPVPSLDVFRPSDAAALADDLCFHDNRYAWIGQDLKRTLVRFRWDAVAFAEIRDLNRHRPGTKYCPLLPNGFYSAMDQVDAVLPPDKAARLVALAECGRAASAEARRRLAAGESEYIYWTLLGTQYPFEHNTTADKFIYEAELRTGTGAHFRYAQHLHDMLALWFDRFPETRGLILEGTAEPE
jgi:hypothetical protein